MPKKSGGKSGHQRQHSQPGSRPVRPVRPVPPAPTAPAATEPPPERAPVPPPRPIASARSLGPVRAARPSSRAPLITDYSYVGADLKRIALLAVGAFVIIGGLTLVIH